MIPQVGGFQGCYLDNHRNNWRCARAVRKRPQNTMRVMRAGVVTTRATLGTHTHRLGPPVRPIHYSSPFHTMRHSTLGPGRKTSPAVGQGASHRHLIAVVSHLHAQPPTFGNRTQLSYSGGSNGSQGRVRGKPQGNASKYTYLRPICAAFREDDSEGGEYRGFVLILDPPSFRGSVGAVLGGGSSMCICLRGRHMR